MAERRDKDEIERSPRRPMAPKSPSAMTAALPSEEPNEPNLGQQRRELARQVEELASTLHYMGTGHPQRQATEQRLGQLRAMLSQMAAADQHG
ncbi:MAG: hypothetical protein V3T05_04330 [Myxococcota bacterium]